MRQPDELAALERAEQYFDALGVAYDVRVVGVYRLRILKRFGLEKAAIDTRHAAAGPDERWRRYRDALRAAHDQFSARLRDGAPAGAPRSACTPCPGCAGR